MFFNRQCLGGSRSMELGRRLFATMETGRLHFNRLSYQLDSGEIVDFHLRVWRKGILGLVYWTVRLNMFERSAARTFLFVIILIAKKQDPDNILILWIWVTWLFVIMWVYLSHLVFTFLEGISWLEISFRDIFLCFHIGRKLQICDQTFNLILKNITKTVTKQKNYTIYSNLHKQCNNKTHFLTFETFYNYGCRRNILFALFFQLKKNFFQLVQS